MLPQASEFVPFKLVNKFTDIGSCIENGRSVMRTGNDDIQAAQILVEQNGESQKTCWEEPVDVGGYAGTQFPPYMKNGTPLSAWGGPLQRMVPLMSTGAVVKFHGVELYRYSIRH